MRCPSCMREVPERSWICPTCDYILDVEALGVRPSPPIPEARRISVDRERPNPTEAVRLPDDELPDDVEYEVDELDHTADAMILGDLTLGLDELGAVALVEAPGVGEDGTTSNFMFYTAGDGAQQALPNVVLERTDVDPTTVPRTPYESFILAAIDGRRTVRAIQRGSPLSASEALICCLTLLDRGLVRIKEPAKEEVAEATLDTPTVLEPAGSLLERAVRKGQSDGDTADIEVTPSTGIEDEDEDEEDANSTEDATLWVHAAKEKPRSAPDPVLLDEPTEARPAKSDHEVDTVEVGAFRRELSGGEPEGAVDPDPSQHWADAPAAMVQLDEKLLRDLLRSSPRPRTSTQVTEARQEAADRDRASPAGRPPGFATVDSQGDAESTEDDPDHSFSFSSPALPVPAREGSTGAAAPPSPRVAAAAGPGAQPDESWDETFEGVALVPSPARAPVPAAGAAPPSALSLGLGSAVGLREAEAPVPPLHTTAAASDLGAALEAAIALVLRPAAEPSQRSARGAPSLPPLPSVSSPAASGSSKPAPAPSLPPLPSVSSPAASGSSKPAPAAPAPIASTAHLTARPSIGAASPGTPPLATPPLGASHASLGAGPPEPPAGRPSNPPLRAPAATVNAPAAPQTVPSADSRAVGPASRPSAAPLISPVPEAAKKPKPKVTPTLEALLRLGPRPSEAPPEPASAAPPGAADAPAGAAPPAPAAARRKGQADPAVAARELFEAAVRDKKRGDPVAARMNLKLALSFDPTNAEYRSLLEALAAGVATGAGSPRNKKIHDQVTRAERAGRIEEAISLLEAEARDYHDPAAYNRLGVILAMRKWEFRRAQEMLQKAIELAPDNPTYRHNLGKVASMMKAREGEGARQKDKKGGGGFFGFFRKKKG